MKKITRRGLIGAGLSVAGLTVGRSAMAAIGGCQVGTPEQTEGPFYPISDQADKDNDLTVVRDRPQTASGEVVLIRGQVTDDQCQPIAGALVEIWQAAHTGKYNHPGDPNPAPLDPNFQYWGRDVTDDEGFYQFKTIVPGEYQATSDWNRPPHIHFKVQRRGFAELTTQMYFAGHPLNQDDRILQALAPAEQKSVVVDFLSEESAWPEGRFDIVLQNI